jgi:hypothetical protein
MSITEFLLARIAEDEADAADLARLGRALSGPPYWAKDRFLAECKAKRQILSDYENELREHELRPYHGDGGECEGPGLQMAIWRLASVYADHPDYRPEWRVSD